MFDVTLIAADWWGWVVPVVFIIIYLVNHLLAGSKVPAKQREAQQRRKSAPPAERPLRPGQAPQQQGGQSQLNAEIEQFLKRANERRMEKTRREAPVASRPPLAAPAAPLREQVSEIEPLAHRDFDTVEESVKQHFGNRGFEQRAEHLADDVTHLDVERAQHLKQVFDHRLGNLDRGSDDPKAPQDVKPPVTRADPTATAQALAGLLTNQTNVRQAILLKEILERPVDRW